MPEASRGPRDRPEDTGCDRHQHRCIDCGRDFIGIRRRMVCHICHERGRGTATARQSDLPQAALILARVRISRAEVIRLTGSTARIELPDTVQRDRYTNLIGETQRQMRDTLRFNEPMILAMAIEGWSAEATAACFGASRECIQQRLRPHGLVRRPGKPKVQDVV